MKYIYKYAVYYNNARDGVQFITAFDCLTDALNKKRAIEYSPRGGACDVVKKRFTLNGIYPIVKNIYNNQKYTEA